MPYANFAADCEYLTNKFRKPVFEDGIGLTNSELIEKVDEIAAANQHLPVAVVKAMCFDYVCKNMQIDVNPHDCYPGFGCYDRIHRPLGNVIYAHNLKRLNPKCMEEMGRYYDAGISSQWIDFDHSVPEWDNIMSLGFPGLQARARAWRAEHEKNGTLTDDVRAYFDGMDATLQSVLDNIDRLIEFARSRHPENPRIQREIECLEQLRQGPPQDFYQALMIDYLFFFYAEHIDHMQVRSMGNLDDMLYPFYKRDLESGRYTEEDIREFLACFMMQFGSINNYWGHPFYLGGTAADGSTLYNPLSSIILEVFEQLDIPTPKIQLKIAGNTPEWLWRQAMDMVRKHNSSLVFVSEENAIKSLLHRGVSAEDARRHNVTGCYEIAPRNSNITGSGAPNLVKCVELVFNDGYSKHGDFQCKCDTLKLEEIKSFDDFMKAYLDYCAHLLEKVVEFALDYEQHLELINPGQLYSSTCDNSLKRGYDAFAGGTVHSWTSVGISALGTAVDALMAVKKLVFDDKKVTLTELRDILNANWEGHENLRLQMLYHAPKYGNGNPEVDKLADRIVKFCAKLINGRPNARGGYFTLSGHAARQFVVQGERTGATPDGRKAGDEISKNISPTMGADTNGVTALGNTICTLDNLDMPGDFPLDVMMHPATVKGEDGLAAMIAFVRTLFRKGGMQVHFNIFNVDTLKDAQKNPERYANLQVRVCGWNVRFTELAEKEQNAYIERATRIIE